MLIIISYPFLLFYLLISPFYSSISPFLTLSSHFLFLSPLGIGESVNLASRLMAKANGEVLVDESTHSHLHREGRKNLRLVEKSMIVKGSKAPIRPYLYVSHEDPAQTIGRDSYHTVFFSLNLI